MRVVEMSMEALELHVEKWSGSDIHPHSADLHLQIKVDACEFKPDSHLSQK